MRADLRWLLRTLAAPLSDERFAVLQYRRRHGRRPELRPPRTFNEQILWLKLYCRDPLLRTCADKFAVRDWVRARLGDRYLVPLLGVYGRPREIPFANLPEQFVLKATHGSGWNIFCRDRATLDPARVRRQLGRWLRQNYYRVGREWAYDGVPARILCEPLLAGPGGQPPWDYKLFCFAGTPRYVQVDYGRFTAHTRAFYDPDWRRVPCRCGYPAEPRDSPRPAMLAEMLAVATELARGFPFVRVDLYEVAGRVFFGELTFYPGNGGLPFIPAHYDGVFGDWLAGSDWFARRPDAGRQR